MSDLPSHHSIKINRKPVWAAIVLLLVFGTLMLVSFGYSYSQSALDKTRIGLISDLTLLSQQLRTTMLTTVKSNTGSFEELETEREQFKEKLQLLIKLEGDSSFAGSHNNLNSLDMKWQSYDAQLEHILKYKSAITNTHLFAETVYVTLPGLQKAAEQVILRIEKEGGDAKQLNVAISQLILLQKIQNDLLLMLQGRSDVENIIQGFVQNTTKFDEKLKSLLKGDRHKDIAPVENKGARFYLIEIEKKFNDLSEEISALLDNATLMQTVYDSVEISTKLGENVFLESQALKGKVSGREEIIRRVSIAAYIFGVFGLFSLIGLSYALFYDHRLRLKFTEEENSRNQEAIMHLMNRMTALSQGDLTVSAQVSKGLTGSIADAFNYTIEALRDLVTHINSTSEQLNIYAQKADKTAGNLSTASKEQSNEVTAASVAINTITENVKRVADYAMNSTHVARKALGISQQGADTVRETLEGMHAIREQAQVTAKRIKRLSESSQEVSHISQLMNDIAEQTQVLALNASIQMSSAGDAGKGFGGVAEEVQMLAKKAATTSRKTEALVKTMQVDTQKTVMAMEETIANVVLGTKSAENAGKALEEIETESERISKLMTNIAKITKDQLHLSVRSKNKLLSIQDINLQAFERVKETTDLINSLTSTANELQVSVYRFKLPSLDNESLESSSKETNLKKMDLNSDVIKKELTNGSLVEATVDENMIEKVL